jgi:DNA invertase Pin-like site-specific DNA recombinase
MIAAASWRVLLMPGIVLPELAGALPSQTSQNLFMMRGMTPTRDTRTLVAYTRVSTNGQAESGIGLQAQRRAIREACEAQRIEVTAWHEDAGRSGASMRKRDGLRAALEDVRAGRADGLVVAKIDRLGRSSADVLGLVEQAQREGWRLLALDVGLDTTTPSGELVAAALAMAARFEWRRISERQQEKFAELRRQGRPRGRAAAPAAVADEIRGLREQGLSFAAIAETMNDRRVATVRGGQKWFAATVRSVYLTRVRELAAQAA